jgi:hypothetical protein
MLRLLIAILLLPQDSELDRLVQRLGDNDPVLREEATRRIREIGPRAQEALAKVRESSDPEMRARANALLQQFERDRIQAALEAKERPKVFPRVTIDVAEAPLENVLKELGQKTGMIWETEDISLKRTVTLKARDMPLIEALERIGLCRFMELSGKVVLRETPEAPLATFADGVRFTFARRTWSPKGEPLGTIFETKMVKRFEGDVKWSVAGIRTDHDLTVETCAIHSPERVYVSAPALADPRVTVKGTRRWNCPTPIDFPEPKNGDAWRAGPYEVIVEWPAIRVRVDHPIEESALGKTLSSRDIRFQAKPGRERKDQMGVGIGGGGGGRYGGRFGNKDLAWCGCDGQPATKNPNLPPMATDRRVGIAFGEDYPIGDIASISVTFHKPVEESFEVTSPPLK